MRIHSVALVVAILVPTMAVRSSGAAFEDGGTALGTTLPRRQETTIVEGIVDPALFQAMRYRMIGPHKGTRSTAVSGVPGQPFTYFFGGTGGGVWKTTDAGEHWFNVSDPYFETGAVGAIAVAASDPSVIYVGTGSACIRGNVTPGLGVYKSTDQGETWSHSGLRDVGQIGKIRVHPKDASVVWVAAFGNAFAPNPDRGIYRSRDGGESWGKVLFVSDRTGAVDLAMHPTDPDVLYAAMWTAERKPWAMFSGSEEGGLYKTTDGGDTWLRLKGGLPTGLVGRIGVSVSPADPNRVWALVEAQEGGLYRSDDGGKSFRLINHDMELWQRSWYYMHVFADPEDPDVVYVGNRYFLKSSDGGESFGPLPMPHGDNHDLWINPDDPKIMIEGNDGGAGISFNGGRSWSTQLNQPTAEIYRVDVDDGFPYRVYGSQQDTYVIHSLPSRSVDFGAKLQLQYWDGVAGMEGGVASPTPGDPNIVYGGGTSGNIYRYDRRTGQGRPIRHYPEGGGMPAKYLKYRFQRTAPIHVSVHDPDVVYHTSQYVHRTSDGGQTWQVISPDLTTDDEERQSTFGGPIVREVTSEEIYSTIYSFGESPSERGVLWTGSDDGRVHVSRDDGATWTDVTPALMPEWGTVNSLDISEHRPGKVIIAVHRYRLGDNRPYVFQTTDYGDSWNILTDGANGIPEDRYVRVVREDPDREGLLYAGTDFGMYVSFDAGTRWQPFQLNLPVTPITDIEVHEKDLVLSTQGRSFWILDDLTPLHQITDEMQRAEAWLFAPRAPYRVRTSIEEADNAYVGGADHVTNLRDLYGGARIDRHRMGTEAPNGAIIYTYLRRPVAEEVVLEILDASGGVLRRFSSQDEHPPAALRARPEAPWRKERDTFWGTGMNRFVWDLRLPADPRGGSRNSNEAFSIHGSAVSSKAARPLGPIVVPGAYTVRLRVGDWTQSRSLEVLADPRIDTTAADYREQLGLLLRIQDRISQIHETVDTIREMRDQLLGGGGSDGPLDHQVRVERQLEVFAEVERRLVPTDEDTVIGRLDFPPKLLGEFNRLYGYVAGAAAKPTEGAYLRFDDLTRDLGEQLDRLSQVESR